MLFHVTMMHTEDNCPAYQREKMPDVLAALETSEALAKELNIKLHSFLWGSPEHVAYATIEADSLGAVQSFVFAIPLRQTVKVTPVQNVPDLVKATKAMMGQG